MTSHCDVSRLGVELPHLQQVTVAAVEIDLFPRCQPALGRPSPPQLLISVGFVGVDDLGHLLRVLSPHNGVKNGVGPADLSQSPLVVELKVPALCVHDPDHSPVERLALSDRLGAYRGVLKLDDPERGEQVGAMLADDHLLPGFGEKRLPRAMPFALAF